MHIMTVGVDGGNNEVKIYGESGAMKFLSNLGEYRERRLESKFSDDDIVFEYNGEKGFAGTLAKFESEFITSRMGDTKAHEDFLLRVLIGLHRYSEETDFRIIVGQPINRHNNEEKQKMKLMLQGAHEITVNNLKKTITIHRAEIAAEGGASYWSNSRAGLVRILDFGSGTVNAASLFDGKYIDRDSFSLTMGLNTMLSPDYSSFGKSVALNCLKKWSEADTVLIVGGGASLMLEHIQKYFPNAEILVPKVKVREGNTIKVETVDTVFANAVGFYEIGKRVFK
jgi:plasmid segregation protein ParM